MIFGPIKTPIRETGFLLIGELWGRLKTQCFFHTQWYFSTLRFIRETPPEPP